MDREEKRSVVNSLIISFAIVLVLWIVKFIEVALEINFISYSILPRTLSGLPGVIASPFIHADYTHLISNSIPLFVLTASLIFFYRPLAFRVLIFSWILSGFWVWLSGRPYFHVGASGVTYALTAFLFVSGIIRKDRRLMAISLLVTFLYGSILWGILPVNYRISWEGHLFGIFAGVFLAFFYKEQGPQRPKYSWELEPEDDENEDEQQWNNEPPKENEEPERPPGIHYHIKPKE